MRINRSDADRIKRLIANLKEQAEREQCSYYMMSEIERLESLISVVFDSEELEIEGIL